MADNSQAPSLGVSALGLGAGCFHDTDSWTTPELSEEALRRWKAERQRTHLGFGYKTWEGLELRFQQLGAHSSHRKDSVSNIQCKAVLMCLKIGLVHRFLHLSTLSTHLTTYYPSLHLFIIHTSVFPSVLLSYTHYPFIHSSVLSD